MVLNLYGERKLNPGTSVALDRDGRFIGPRSGVGRDVDREPY